MEDVLNSRMVAYPLRLLQCCPVTDGGGALILTGALAFVGQALIVPRVTGRIGAAAGHLLLVVARSFPEYMLAYCGLQLLGPSMLPAILALALHNAGIVAYLMGRHADALPYRADAPTGLNLYAYETVPRVRGA